jgi:glycosyltransferase involved in cell wall biosynthesis
MKIAMLSHLASESAPTGAERVLDLIARGLVGRGHRVSVSAPGPWAFESSLGESGVEVKSIPIRCCWLVQADRQPAWRQLVRGVRFLLPDPGERELEAFLSEVAPDVVHVNCLPHLRGAAAARATGHPVVWHIHEIMPPGVRRRWFAGRLRRDATRIVAVSEAVGQWLREEHLGASLDVVHNGVDVPEPLPDRGTAREKFELPAKAVVFGLFSQLVPHKGAINFVRAAHQMTEKSPETWFLVAGHGPPSFVAELHRVDVLALTTLWPDPLPRVVMEAMAAGRPVVAYEGGGVPEMVVNGDTGLLCAPGDVDELSSAMAHLAGKEGLRQRMAEAGARRAREHFSVERHLHRMEAVLEAARSARG